MTRHPTSDADVARLAPIALVEYLKIADGNGRLVLHDVSLTVRPGERVGVVGESGAGKTTLALALLGAIRPGLRRRAGQVRIAGHEILHAPAPVTRALRRHTIAYLPQDPAASLTPTLRAGAQVAELADDPRPDAVAERLRAVGLPGDRAFRRRYPHELSGGQRQRLALARTLAGDPQILVLDEPTTGLDVHARDTVLTEIDRLARRLGLALIVISHDLAAVARLTDHLVVLRDGRLVDHGSTVQALRAPAHPYTAQLVAASPELAAMRPARRAIGPPVLEVCELHAEHGRSAARTIATAGVSFTVQRATCVALVGASGSGKTTIARCLAGLHPPAAGTIHLDGELLAGDVRRRPLAQRRRLQLISQDPAGCLNPRRSVAATVARPLRRLHDLDRASAHAEARRLLELVGLDPGTAARRPSTLSGGECQRVAIARALAAQPDVLVCDEITSALDTSTQAAILDLLDDLRDRLGLAIVLIAHDLAVAARAADHVLVLDDGRVHEQGDVKRVLTRPSGRIARELLRASSSLGQELADRKPPGVVSARQRVREGR